MTRNFIKKCILHAKTQTLSFLSLLKIRLLIFTVLTMLLTVTTPLSSTTVQTLTWKIRNSYKHTIDLKFYTSDLKHVWPSSSEHYILDDREIHTFNLRCYSGAKICYGARSGNSYWGIDIDGKKGCSNCCYTCGEETRGINLTSDDGEVEPPKPEPPRPSPTPSQNAYGAIAISINSSGRLNEVIAGLATDSSQALANDYALRKCRESGGMNCQVVYTFANGQCGFSSLGSYRNGSVTWGVGPTSAWAQYYCSSQGASCKTPRGFCTQ